LDENIYETPKSDLVKESREVKLLATRWQRLGASLLDSSILLVVLVPFIYYTWN